MMISAILAIGAANVNAQQSQPAAPSGHEGTFEYNNERFADLQMLRYRVDGFDQLTLKQKTFIYYLQEAALYGRDILFDQNGKYNLRIRKMLEDVYQNYEGDRNDEQFKALEVYLKRVWFSNGIHHHYGCEKFVPGFTKEWLKKQVNLSDEIAESAWGEAPKNILDVMFNPSIMVKRVNLAEGEDLVKTSASNYYENVTQAEAEDFYNRQKAEGDSLHPVMYGMNSRLVKTEKGDLIEKRWTTNGLYGAALKKIVNTGDPAEAYEAARKLQDIPKNANPIRLHNRCKITGRPKGYMRQFGLSRIQFREMASNGLIPGVKKASW